MCYFLHLSEMQHLLNVFSCAVKQCDLSQQALELILNIVFYWATLFCLFYIVIVWRCNTEVTCKKGRCSSLWMNPWQSYGASPAIWDHTVLPATRHRWACPALTPAMQAGTRFTYPGGMEGWVGLTTRKRSRRESNSRPLGPESNALTTEPRRSCDLTWLDVLAVTQCDFEVRILRELNQQALKLVADAVRQHPDIGHAAHLYFSQVAIHNETSLPSSTELR